MNSYIFKPIKAYIITIKDDESLSCLFFLYKHNDKLLWRLTSNIKFLQKDISKTVVTTNNSVYTLKTTSLIQISLTPEEYLLCRMGVAPDEAKLLIALLNETKYH